MEASRSFAARYPSVLLTCFNAELAKWMREEMAADLVEQRLVKRVMEKFLIEHAEIDAVLSANDSMALGVLEALKAANRTAIVIGINGILPAVKQIETGGMLASVDFNMFKIGCTATRAAVRHLRKEPLPEKVMLPAEVIDKSNYKAWLVPVDQRTCPEWADVAR